FERSAHRRFIIDNQDTVQAIPPPRGKITLKTVPFPISLFVLILPPCCSTTARHTVKPSPGFPAVVVNPESKIFPRCSAAIPHPESSKSIRTSFRRSKSAHVSRTESI